MQMLATSAFSPQADTVELTAKFFKLMAALISRSCDFPQLRQVQRRRDNGIAAQTALQVEQVLLLGYHRSAT